MALSAARSDVGRKRTINEDSFIANDPIGLFAVADGMGGHAGGEVASKIAAETLLSFIQSSSADTEITWPFGFSPALSVEANQLRNAIQLANQLIVNRATAEPALQTMGSTIIVCLLKQGSFAFGNVGDSRLYLWRRGELRQVSEDDSWAASMLRAGASAEMVSKHEMRHVLTRALGSPQALEVTIGEHALEDGDVLLLCSDGLYGPVGEETIAKVLSAPGLSLADRADALVETANAAGGPDNITAILVKYDTEATVVIERPIQGGLPWHALPDSAPPDAAPQASPPADSTLDTLVGVTPRAPAHGEADGSQDVSPDHDPNAAQDVWTSAPELRASAALC